MTRKRALEYILKKELLVDGYSALRPVNAEARRRRQSQLRHCRQLHHEKDKYSEKTTAKSNNTDLPADCSLSSYWNQTCFFPSEALREGDNASTLVLNMLHQKGSQQIGDKMSTTAPANLLPTHSPPSTIPLFPGDAWSSLPPATTSSGNDDGSNRDPCASAFVPLAKDVFWGSQVNEEAMKWKIPVCDTDTSWNQGTSAVNRTEKDVMEMNLTSLIESPLAVPQKRPVTSGDLLLDQPIEAFDGLSSASGLGQMKVASLTPGRTGFDDEVPGNIPLRKPVARRVAERQTMNVGERGSVRASTASGLSVLINRLSKCSGREKVFIKDLLLRFSSSTLSSLVSPSASLRSSLSLRKSKGQVMQPKLDSISANVEIPRRHNSQLATIMSNDADFVAGWQILLFIYENSKSYTDPHSIATNNLSAGTIAWLGDLKDEVGRSYLHAVVAARFTLSSHKPYSGLRMLEMLLDLGFNINDRDNAGETPLMALIRVSKLFQCEYGATLEFLLHNGAQVNLRNLNGESALHLAVWVPIVELSRYTTNILLQYGADIEARNAQGNTALHLAVLSHHVEALMVLLKHGTRTELTNFAGDSPLHLAVKYPSLTATRTLLEHGIKINMPNLKGEAPLHLAVKLGRVDITKILLEYGANVHCITTEGLSVLALATNAQRSAKKSPTVSHYSRIAACMGLVIDTGGVVE